MSNQSLSGAGRSVHRRGDHSGRTFRFGTAAFVIAAIVALLITLSGARELWEQLDEAPDGSSHLITMVLGFGLVLLGPVLLAALAVLMPRHWLPGVFERMGDWLTGDRVKNNPTQTSR